MNLYIDEKGNYKEVHDFAHYIKNNGKGSLMSYTKEQTKAKYAGGSFDEMIKREGYRKAKADEVKEKFAFTKEKLTKLGYREANEGEVKKFYGGKIKVEKVKSTDKSPLTKAEEKK